MPTRELGDSCSVLQQFVPDIFSQWPAGSELRIIQVLRTDDEQVVLYAQGRKTRGRIVTKCDGVVKKSRHQLQELHDEVAAHAVDIGIFIDGKFQTDTALYRPLAALVSDVGLQSGFSYGDFDHAQCIVSLE